MAPVTVYALLLPGYSLLALASLADVVHALNQTRRSKLAQIVLVTPDDAPASSSAGLAFADTRPFLTASDDIDADKDLLIVISDAPLPEDGFDATIDRLRSYSGMALGGVGTGAWLLARAGLLDGHRATIDWPYSVMFAEEFPRVIATSNLFELAPRRLTAAAGTAALDLMLAWVARQFGDDPVTDIADALGLERVRPSDQPQRVPLSARIGGGQPKLTEAVALMEANIAEPLPTEDIARLVGVSRRQLERLFKQYLESLPSRYYLELRLVRSRALLTQTSQSILQIGLSCGFSSGPHFSSAYRNHFGLTPREERSKRLPGAYRGGQNDKTQEET